ncbi:MAG: helix-turn-helix domain-containing protein [Lactobacillaceae bacterium]|nr:helix-turn-helix domain-containing protein [Lactobacillaceae bacterium]
MEASEGKLIMGANIKRLLKKNRMTAAKLAEVVNVSTATISDWSNGKTYPRVDKVEVMAEFFGVSRSELVEDPDTLLANAETSEEPTLMAAHWGIDITGLPEADRQRVVDRAKAYIEGLIADFEDHDA